MARTQISVFINQDSRLELLFEEGSSALLQEDQSDVNMIGSNLNANSNSNPDYQNEKNGFYIRNF